MLKRLLCRIFGHKLTMDWQRRAALGWSPWRLRCVRCGAEDPYQQPLGKSEVQK